MFIIQHYRYTFEYIYESEHYYKLSVEITCITAVNSILSDLNRRC